MIVLSLPRGRSDGLIMGVEIAASLGIAVPKKLSY
jgi:hypothetical protein